jgi:hypothetical protein
MRNSIITKSNILQTSNSFETSALINGAFLPAETISAFFSPCFVSISFIITVALFSAKSSAIALPIPLAAPVIIAIFP